MASWAGKRPGESSTSIPVADEHDSKKLRFDTRDPSKLAAEESEEDEEDVAILGLDSIGKSVGPSKRSAVNLDGFESDSDNDNFNQRAADRAKEQKKGAKKGDDSDEDDDMFASEEEDAKDDPDTAVKKKKQVKFVNNDDIVGQDYSSKSMSNANFDLTDESGRVQDVGDEESDSESGGDEGRDAIGSGDDEQELGAGSKKKHAPRLDAFNIRDEGQEGRFDENGNFVRQNDPNSVHDAWLEGVSKKEMKKARDAEKQREMERKKKTMEKDAMLTQDLLGMLITRLEIGENPLEALQRLGKAKQKQKPKWQKKKNAMEVESTQSVNEKENERKEAVESITEAADQLLSRGMDDIYDTEREVLVRLYKRESGEDWVEPTRAGHSEDENADQWEFRWTGGQDDGVHGPYDTTTMRSWNEAGYFANGNVEFRRDRGTVWSRHMGFV
jgi:CD2 antigen cytoplasmic tail-binding protein 2